jgi:hypothetical protein
MLGMMNACSERNVVVRGLAEPHRLLRRHLRPARALLLPLRLLQGKV